LQRFYDMMTGNEKVVKYLKDVRKPKNSETIVKLARTALSHLQI